MTIIIVCLRVVVVMIIETFRLDEYEFDYEYEFLETIRFDYEYEFLEIFRFDYGTSTSLTTSTSS